MRQAPKPKIISDQELHLLRDSKEKAVAIKLAKTFRECEVPYEIVLDRENKTVFINALIDAGEVETKIAEYKKERIKNG